MIIKEGSTYRALSVSEIKSGMTFTVVTTAFSNLPDSEKVVAELMTQAFKDGYKVAEENEG